jgi:hypothetical protein
MRLSKSATISSSGKTKKGVSTLGVRSQVRTNVSFVVNPSFNNVHTSESCLGKPTIHRDAGLIVLRREERWDDDLTTSSYLKDHGGEAVRQSLRITRQTPVTIIRVPLYRPDPSFRSVTYPKW